MSSATIDRYLRGAKARDQITGKSTLQTAVNAAADRVQTAVDATADWARASVNAAADWVGTAVIATVDWVQTAVTATLDWVQSAVNSAITIGRNIVNAGTSWLFNLVGIDGMCQKLQPQRHSTMVVAAGSALPRSQRLMLGTPPQPVGDPWTRPSIQVMQLAQLCHWGPRKGWLAIIPRNCEKKVPSGNASPRHCSSPSLGWPPTHQPAAPLGICGSGSANALGASVNPSEMATAADARPRTTRLVTILSPEQSNDFFVRVYDSCSSAEKILNPTC